MGISSEQLQRLIDAETAGGGGGASTTADGADVAQGALADAVVAAGAAGSLSAKLRRLTTDLGALLTLLPSSLGAKTAAASLSVTQASDQVGPGVDVVASGALGALNNAVTISTKGLASVVAEVDTGTLSGTVTYEGTSDDSNWFSIIGLPAVTAGAWGSTETAFGSRRLFSVGGLSQFRARVSAYTSGTSNARLRGSISPHIVRLGPGLATSGGAVDGASNTISQIVDSGGANRLLGIVPHAFNGATWDRIRNAIAATLLASAARTTTQTSADIPTYNLTKLKVILDMTVVGTGSVTLTINAKDPASGKYVLLLAGVAVTTNVTNVYTVYPGAPVAANVSANDMLGQIIQIVVTANNANSATYSVGYVLGT